MAKLSKHELARKTIRDVYVQIEDGARLADLVAKYGIDCWVDVDYGYYDDPTSFYLVHDREETDEEYEIRINEAKERERSHEAKLRDNRKRKDEEERKTYARLKAKFEKEL